MKKNIALVLCGSGFKDGSEIRESVAVLWALDRLGAQVDCFAPDEEQTDVIDCLKNQPMSEKRNMLVEAARIARGQIRPLTQYKASEYDGLAFPGGYGVAKNLCTFASDGANGRVRLVAKQAIDDAFAQSKPILAVCISPALIALALKDKAKLSLTLGEAGDAAHEISKLGHKHIVQKVTECHVDRDHKIVTTPAYMYADAHLADIFTGIETAVRQFLQLC